MSIELKITVVSFAVAFVVVGVPVLIAIYRERKQRGG